MAGVIAGRKPRDKVGFQRFCALDEIPVGSSLQCEAAGCRIALIHCEAGVSAISGVSTHARARLSDGAFDGVRCAVECPLHGVEFDVRSGAVLTPPATAPAATYPVRVREGVVEVGVGGEAAGEE